jgi:hypothetical protein
LGVVIHHHYSREWPCHLFLRQALSGL